MSKRVSQTPDMVIDALMQHIGDVNYVKRRQSGDKISREEKLIWDGVTLILAYGGKIQRLKLLSDELQKSMNNIKEELDNNKILSI